MRKGYDDFTMYNIVEVSSDTNIGGAGKCLITLARFYDRSKFNMTVILPRNSLLKPHIEELGVKIIEADGIAEKSLDFGSVKNLRKLFRELKPDLVHTHASMSARIAARQSGTRVVYTRHSVFAPSPKISKGVGKLINGMINNYYSDSIIAVAEAAKDNLVQTGVSDKKITVILNGVDGLVPDNAEIKAQTKKRFGIGKDDKVVSIVARLEDIKGHDYFIDAAKRFVGKNVKFVIAGTGSYEEHLKRRVKDENLEDTVIFTGFISDVERLMNITDIQVNASFGTEATSLALLEGMSLGIPAVVSDFGGNPGVISSGENGFVVQKKNADALAEKIAYLLENPDEYAKMSDSSRQIFGEKFTAEVMTRNTENLYIETIRKG